MSVSEASSAHLAESASGHFEVQSILVTTVIHNTLAMTSRPGQLETIHSTPLAGQLSTQQIPNTVPTSSLPSPRSLSSSLFSSSSLPPAITSMTILSTPASITTATSTRSNISFAGPSSFNPILGSKGSTSDAYNPTTLIICLAIIGLIFLAAVSGFVRRTMRRSRGRDRNLQTIIDVEERRMVQKWSSSTDRLSTITASIGRPSESTEKEAENSETSWSYNTSDLRDSVIGVATTSSVPASSSKSAIAPGAYPKLESPQRTVLDRQMSAGGAFDVGRLMMAEHQGGDGALTEPLKRGSDRKPVPMVEIENLVVESTPLSGTNHLKREPSYRSPTESIYGCYQDQEKTQDAEDEEKKRADGQDRN